jgi:hypothetical protein
MHHNISAIVSHLAMPSMSQEKSIVLLIFHFIVNFDELKKQAPSPIFSISRNTIKK